MELTFTLYIFNGLNRWIFKHLIDGCFFVLFFFIPLKSLFRTVHTKNNNYIASTPTHSNVLFLFF